MIEKGHYLVKDSEVLFTSMGDDAVLLHVQRGDYYSLNKVGARLWSITDGSKTIGDLAGEITEEFEISREEAEKDIIELAGQLAKEGLVKVVETPQDDEAAQEPE
ncbi:MAG: PqqD family protein [Thermoleophilia bacterium]|nr:PqqD family protein [Thermoleophilia bacterium]